MKPPLHLLTIFALANLKELHLVQLYLLHALCSANMYRSCLVSILEHANRPWTLQCCYCSSICYYDHTQATPVLCLSLCVRSCTWQVPSWGTRGQCIRSSTGLHSCHRPQLRPGPLRVLCRYSMSLATMSDSRVTGSQVASLFRRYDFTA